METQVLDQLKAIFTQPLSASNVILVVKKTVEIVESFPIFQSPADRKTFILNCVKAFIDLAPINQVERYLLDQVVDSCLSSMIDAFTPAPPPPPPPPPPPKFNWKSMLCCCCASS